VFISTSTATRGNEHKPRVKRLSHPHPLARRIDELLETEPESVRAALAALAAAIERALAKARANGIAATTSG
jgi:hypothetical protein